ncbi:hypothetical protein POM88_016048 [Heracleum sosnowskyi]|uniref:ABC transporter domain-containing protein n=1 Tax=Heracleum sosnowskyi TaxID=360622 RepID=A0AAD8MSK8_9APIA|nr:hypothetical protein POM88_016048 [Heracleum sosnowskyi]
MILVIVFGVRRKSLPIKTLKLRWLRQQIGLVSQEPALFATSIKENILLGRPDASLVEIEEAARVWIQSVPIMDSKTPRKGAVIKKEFKAAVDNVHAYIVFKSDESAKASLSHNMAVVGGNHIRVDRACPPRKKLKGDDVPLYDCKRTVFIV